MIEELWGLPAHPLLVHFPIVLIPILAIGAVAMAARPVWRQRFNWQLSGACAIAAVSAFVAAQAGKSFEEDLQPSLGSVADRHAELGDQSVLLAVLFLTGAVLVTAMDRWYSTRRPLLVGREVGAGSVWVSRVAAGIAVVTAIIGVVATVWVIRAGHEGARITWLGVDIGGG